MPGIAMINYIGDRFTAVLLVAKQTRFDYNFIIYENIPKHKAKIWRVKASDPVLSQIFAHKLKISPITANVD